MKTTFILLAAILLSGCSHCDDCEPVRTKIPAVSVSGEHYAEFSLYIDGEKSLSSKESLLRISADPNNNAIKGISFETHLYNGQNFTPVPKVIPEPGGLYRISPINLLSIPVTGVPYDVALGYDTDYGSAYSATIFFYGDDEAAMFTDMKTVSDIFVRIKGWMKVRKNYNSPYELTVSYDCDIAMSFTVEDVEYCIKITRTQPVRYHDDWFD